MLPLVIERSVDADNCVFLFIYFCIYCLQTGRAAPGFRQLLRLDKDVVFQRSFLGFRIRKIAPFLWHVALTVQIARGYRGLTATIFPRVKIHQQMGLF